MKKILLFPFVLVITILGCAEDSPLSPEKDLIVVRGYLYAGEPVTDIQITSTLPLGSKESKAPPINNAQVALFKEDKPYGLVLSAGDSGYYHYDGDDLRVEAGDEFCIEVVYHDQDVYATSIQNSSPAINNGEVFPADHDRRHEVNIVAKYTRGVYTFAATWVFASGSPYTSPESQYFIPLLDGEINSYIHVSDKNANRLPDYHRLDLSASRKFESDNWSTEIGVSIFNAYNHRNVWYRDYNLDTTPITVTDVLMLGFTPTIHIQMNLGGGIK